MKHAALHSLFCASLSLCFRVGALAHGDLHEQIAALTERIAKEPASAELYLQRGELHRLHEEWRAAEADYDRAAKLAPGLATIDLARGKMLLASQKPGLAKAALNRFLKHHPVHAEALTTRARARAKLGEHAAAATDYSQAIALFARPEPELYLERAAVLASHKSPRVEDALDGLKEGIAKLGPVLTLELAALDLEVRLGRFEPALIRIEKLAAGAQRTEKWLARRGDILASAGRPAEAHEAYSGALKAIESLPPRFRGARNTAALATQVRKSLAALPPAVGKVP